MNKPPRNPATLREKSRRRLLRRIERCEAHIRAHQEDGDVKKQLDRLKESLSIKFPAPKIEVAQPQAPKVKKPRAPRAKKAT